MLWLSLYCGGEVQHQQKEATERPQEMPLKMKLSSAPYRGRRMDNGGTGRGGAFPTGHGGMAVRGRGGVCKCVRRGEGP